MSAKPIVNLAGAAAAPVCKEDGTCEVPASAGTTAATKPAAAATATPAAAAPEKQVLNIAITTDPICPWCFVGHRRLEKALAQLDSTKVEVRKTINPFFLDPTLPTASVSKMERYIQRFGAQRVGQMLPHMKEVGKAEGINFSYGGKIGNTLNAHRLLQWAATPASGAAEAGPKLQEKLLMVMYRMYFEQEQDIADLATLAKAAAEVGIAQAAAQTFLEGKEMASDIAKAAQANMMEHGISGVPFFVIQNQYAVSGAQDPAFFVNVFKKIGLPLAKAK